MFYLQKTFSFLLLIACCLAAGRAPAQTGNCLIKGHIITPDGNAVLATVALQKQGKTTPTDNNGNFRLKATLPLQDTLLITSVELESYSQPITGNAAGTIDVGDVHLSFHTFDLQNVEVKGRRNRSYKSDYSFSATKTQVPVVQIPQTISSVTKELIQDRMDFTLKEAVTEAAGISSYSGYDEYTIRGFRAENARLINGLRGYNTTYTSNMLVNVERVEIIKGPTATLYGNGDPGGTINLVTKKPLEQKEQELSVAGGTWNHIRAGTDVTGPVNKKKTVLYRFNAGYDNTKSFRDLWYDKSYQLAPSFSFVPNGKISLNADVSLSHINTLLDRGQPAFQDGSLKSTPLSLITSQPGDYLHETTLASNVLFSYNINKHLSFNSGYLNYLTQQNVAEHGIQSYITPDSVNLYNSRWRYGTTTNTLTNYLIFTTNTGKVAHQLLGGHDLVISSVRLQQNYFELPDEFGEGSGIAGTFSLRRPVYEYRDTKEYKESGYSSFAGDVDATVYHTNGLYVQDQMSRGKWKLLLGLREEMYRGPADDDDDSAGGSDDEESIRINHLMPRVGLLYALKPNASLYFTYNEGFDPFEASSAKQVFEEPFRPITSQLWEAGAKADLFQNRLYTSLSFYQLTLQNVAVSANNLSNPDLYVQQGEDRSRGVETEISGTPLRNLNVFGSYAYNVTKIIQSKVPSEVGMIRDNAPRHTSNTWIKYTFSKGFLRGFGVAAGHSQVSRRNTLQEGLHLPGYVVLNAGVRYAWRYISVAMNLNNITDKTYWVSAYNNISKWPGTPRNVMVELNYRF